MMKKFTILLLALAILTVSCGEKADEDGENSDGKNEEVTQTEKSSDDEDASDDASDKDDDTKDESALEPEDIELTVSPEKKRIAYGDGVTFTAEISGAERDYTYQWQVRNTEYCYSQGRFSEVFCAPERIEKTRFEEEILAKMPDDIKDPVVKKVPRTYMKAFYNLKDPDNVSKTMREDMYKTFPITEKYPIYILSDATVRDKRNLEHLILTYTDYTYDDLLYDHELVEHKIEDENTRKYMYDTEVWLDLESSGFSPFGTDSDSITVYPIYETEFATELRCVVTDPYGNSFESEPVEFSFKNTDDIPGTVAVRALSIQPNYYGYSVRLECAVGEGADEDVSNTMYEFIYQYRHDDIEKTTFYSHLTPDEDDNGWYTGGILDFKLGMELDTEIRVKAVEQSQRGEPTGKVLYSKVIKVRDLVGE